MDHELVESFSFADFSKRYSDKNNETIQSIAKCCAKRCSFTKKSLQPGGSRDFSKIIANNVVEGTSRMISGSQQEIRTIIIPDVSVLANETPGTSGVNSSTRINRENRGIVPQALRRRLMHMEFHDDTSAYYYRYPKREIGLNRRAAQLITAICHKFRIIVTPVVSAMGICKRRASLK